MVFDIVLDTNKLQLEGLWGSILCNIGTPSESNIKPQSPVLYSEVFIHVLPLQPSQAMSMLWIKSGPASELSPHPLSMTSLLALLSGLQTPTPARTNLPWCVTPASDTWGHWVCWGQGYSLAHSHLAAGWRQWTQLWCHQSVRNIYDLLWSYIS